MVNPHYVYDFSNLASKFTSEEKEDWLFYGTKTFSISPKDLLQWLKTETLMRNDIPEIKRKSTGKSLVCLSTIYETYTL